MRNYLTFNGLEESFLLRNYYPNWQRVPVHQSAGVICRINKGFGMYPVTSANRESQLARLQDGKLAKSVTINMNLKTAKALGLTIPLSLLGWAARTR
jgi:hypothetical protein